MGKTKMNVEYDIAIRTVGYGGGKYQALLDSIKALEFQPKNIWIILPNGKSTPPERLGTEKFVYATPGMMTQRIAALEYSNAPYILFCDDDIQFDSVFVEKLFRSVSIDGFDIATGEVLAFLPPAKGLKKWLPCLHAAAIPRKNDNWFVKILKSSGWTYNRFTPHAGLSLRTQSAAGCMFFASRETMKKLRFEDELWAQHGTVAPMEDQIMFYKAHLLGLQVCVTTDAHYDHLSAQAATSTNESKIAKTKWASFNRVVFWYRFIYSQSNTFAERLKAVVSFLYFCIAEDIHSLLRNILKEKSLRNFIVRHKGRYAAIKFIRTPEYNQIPCLIRNKKDHD